jgi:hypothetical protein
VDGQVDLIELGGLFALRGAGQRPLPRCTWRSPRKVPTITSGAVSLLGLTRETQVSLSDKGFHFRTSGKIFGKFSCALEARGGHLDDTTGFWVEASMENDLLAYLREHATQALQEAARGADSALAAAQGEIVKAEGKVASLDREIAARRRVVESERDETRRTNGTAQAALARARRHEVEELGRQIAALAAAIRAARARDTQSLADARREVRQKQREVDTLLAEIARMRATIQGERDLATRRMTAAQAAVRAAEGNVETIQRPSARRSGGGTRSPRSTCRGRRAGRGRESGTDR